MEEPGEQCIVVFALIVPEQASEYVCVEGVGVGISGPPPPSTSRLRNNYAMFSKFFHALN
jgi:hypothetical protein